MLIDTLEQLKASGVNCRMLFLEADTPTIINRYKETRRMHPLQAKGLSIEEAVRRERVLMQPVRDHADFVLDTSSLSTAKLRSELLNLFGTPSDRGGLNVSVLSFGFKHGIPIEADLVFDVRFMPNPYYVAELKNKTGLDQEVRDFVFSFQQATIGPWSWPMSWRPTSPARDIRSRKITGISPGKEVRLWAAAILWPRSTGPALPPLAAERVCPRCCGG